MGKKNKKEILKRHLKSKQKAKKKKKLHLAGPGIECPIEEIRYRPGISEMGAPPGFRTISMAQAMMEYAKPLIELAKAKDQDINEALQASVLLWNCAVAQEEGKSDSKIEKETLRAIAKIFRMKEKTIFFHLINSPPTIFRHLCSSKKRSGILSGLLATVS